MFVLSQMKLNKKLLQHLEKREIGIGCACSGTTEKGEQEYTCLVAVAEHAPIRDIRERLPIYQEPLMEGTETCSQRCEWLKPQPDFSMMYYTNDCEDIGMFEDDQGFCRGCHEITPGCTRCDPHTQQCLECEANVDGIDY